MRFKFDTSNPLFPPDGRPRRRQAGEKPRVIDVTGKSGDCVINDCAKLIAIDAVMTTIYQLTGIYSHSSMTTISTPSYLPALPNEMRIMISTLPGKGIYRCQMERGASRLVSTKY